MFLASFANNTNNILIYVENIFFNIGPFRIKSLFLLIINNYKHVHTRVPFTCTRNKKYKKRTNIDNGITSSIRAKIMRKNP